MFSFCTKPHKSIPSPIHEADFACGVYVCMCVCVRERERERSIEILKLFLHHIPLLY